MLYQYVSIYDEIIVIMVSLIRVTMSNYNDDDYDYKEA